MFLMRFTERAYVDYSEEDVRQSFRSSVRLTFSNSHFNPALGADLYNAYLDEYEYAEEVGFDGLMLNEHHNTPTCMGAAMNLEAAILARTTKRAKIVLLGNPLPILDNPLRLAEELAEIDMISRGRLVSGFVRGTGIESWATNTNPAYNRERFQEAHDLVLKTWTKPGPFRWEGKHYQYRYVNPFMRPYQKPHPQIMLPGVVSKDSVVWAAKQRIPYVMLATQLEPTLNSFQVYHDTAKEEGYEAGPQNFGYLWKVHVDETEELAEETARKFVQGPSNPFLAGNEGTANPALMSLPGLTSRRRVLPTQQVATANRGGQLSRSFEEQVEDYTIIYGTPDTVIPKIKHVLEYLRPGSVFFWDGDGAMTHDDQMRSLRLMGSDVLPAVREIADELELSSPFDISPKTGEQLPAEIETYSGGIAAGD